MLDEYRTRRDQLYEWLTADPRVRCRKPARRVLPVRRHQRRAVGRRAPQTSTDFAQALLEEPRVAVTPGEAFDAPGFVRISYATSMENLREGSRRLLEFVAQRRDGRRLRQSPATIRSCPSFSRTDTDRMAKVVAVIGASNNRSKFGNRAVRAFRQQGYTVVPINPHETRSRRAEGVHVGPRRPGHDRHGVVLRAAGRRRAGDRRGGAGRASPRSG